ncbi:MAG: nucleotide sugar dehydrogenase [Legionellaceae bacterium]|nr:nucleotide sugar dehydrogenase [Legionellaceae bacterium]
MNVVDNNVSNLAHKKIGCVGMTHLGLVHAVAFADKGFSMVCYDEKPELIEKLQAHKLPVNEPQLDDLVSRNQERLKFTADIDQLKQCDVVFIAYDVPTDDEGNSQLDVIQELLAQVKPVMANHACLVLLSQVPPGFSRQIDFPKERLFYQVETLIFGRAVERALYPERYIIGACEADNVLPKTYAALLATFDCPILKMRYESAELAKISINMFLVASVTTTNTLAEICENIGADWEDISPTLRLDKRIGQHAYLTAGLGIAGGNLERDLNTIIKLGKKYTTDTDTVSAWIKNSKYRRDWVLRCLQENVLNLRQKPIICVLGLAYKPNTHSVKNSPSIALINQLTDFDVNAHDPIVKDEHQTHAIRKDIILDAVSGADVVIIMTPCDEYRVLSIELLSEYMRGNTVIDPHRLLSIDSNGASDLNYYSLGRGFIKTEKKELDYA